MRFFSPSLSLSLPANLPKTDCFTSAAFGRRTGQESLPPSLPFSGCVRRSRLNNGNVSAQRPALENIDAVCMRLGRRAYYIISGRILMCFSHRLLNQIEIDASDSWRFWVFTTHKSERKAGLREEREGEKKRKRPTL